MFQLLNPIALFAAAAVIIPVMIHLWNTRRGKTLKVGSIALLSESSKKPARSLRITNWPLLLLRCLLLVLIAVLMAKPSWLENPSSKSGGWMLIPGNELTYAYQQHHGLIDSLLKKGFELHNLQPKHEKLLLQDSSSYTQSAPRNYSNWSFLRYLDAALPPNYPLYIFSGRLLQDYAGDRPSVNLDIHWVDMLASQQTDTSLMASYVSKDGNVITTKRISTSTGNFYEESAAGPAKIANATAVINIGVYPGNNSADASYLKAAIEAIAEYTGRNILINEGSSPNQQQVIFWLQETEPDPQTLAKLAPGGTILRYGNTAATMQLPSPVNPGFLSLDESNTGLFFKYASDPPKGTVMWTLSNGDPLLSVESTKERKTIRFSSRFNPQWTDLVWKESFARSLIPIILPSFIQADTDLRQISVQQAKVNLSRGKVNGSINDAGFIQRTDLSFAGWILILLLFVAERILSHRQTKQKNA